MSEHTATGATNPAGGQPTGERQGRWQTIAWEQDADGIITLTLDDPAQRANTMTDAYRASMHAAVDHLYEHRESITGVVITSAKKTFFAGGDLNQLIAVEEHNLAEFAAGLNTVKADLRRLETLGRPVVAAINGAAMGGGLELALATHHRVALAGVKLALPEVKLGLLPGGGGLTRVVRMLGVVDGLTKVLVQGTEYRAEAARELGLVDEIAGTGEHLLAAAKAWIKANPQAAQPWDAPGYRMPGGSPKGAGLGAMLPALPGNLRKELKGAPMPAPHHIMCAAVEGAGLEFEAALEVETRYFLNLVTGQVAKNMIGAFWFDLNAINAGASRPAGFEPVPVRRVAVLGAGMMGAGIAYACARAGIEVVLKDVSAEAAERGKAYSQRLMERRVARGRSTEAQRDALLARITPSADYADLAGADLIVEAVFENAGLKKAVFAEAEGAVAPGALLGSNTSTLPITDLASGVHRPADFIGLHFFSPVDRMPLLEIIRGAQTSDAALARALDFAKQIGKTGIVVNDSRGFFTSRVIITFINEAISFLTEGVHPASIEQSALQAGYPVGALQLADELNLGLFIKIRDETKAATEAAGGRYEPHPAEAVVQRLVDAGRGGKLAGAGFYNYDEQGRRTGLWEGLNDGVRPDAGAVDLHELSQRQLVIEAVEAARCVAEGVITQAADANIGSIFGIGYPAWTGGVLQYINGFTASPGAPVSGVAGFVARADELADRYGERFRPNPLLRQMAERGERFGPR